VKEESKKMILDRLKDELEPLLQELRPLLLSLLFLVLGIFLLLAAKRWINDKPTVLGDAVLVSLVLMPILIYTITSGKLKELKGPGGLGATFNTVVSQSDVIVHKRVPTDEDIQIIVKEGRQALHRRLQDLDGIRPIVMTIVLGGERYDLYALREYVKELSRLKSFKLVIFLAQDESFLAFMSPLAAWNTLSTKETGDKFVSLINEKDQKLNRELLTYPGLVLNTISTQSTNGEALRKMVHHNLETLPVVDSDRMKGIVEREQVLSRIVLALDH
jgi:hypothetical protein